MCAYPNINYIDGDQAAAAASMSVYCYNNGQTYASDSADPSPTVVRTETLNSNGQVTGSTNYINQRVGTINLTYDSIDDELDGATKQLLPTYVVSFRGRFYVLGNVSNPITKGEATTVAAEVSELQNPMIPELLSTLGQQKLWTFAAGALPETFALAAVNTRTGATVTYTLENWDSPGDAAPEGFTIDSGNGDVTAASPAAAGTYDLKVVAADTVTPLGEDQSAVRDKPHDAHDADHHQGDHCEHLAFITMKPPDDAHRSATSRLR